MMLKTVMFIATLALCPTLGASKLDLTEEAENVLHTASLHRYADDQGAMTDDVILKGGLTREQVTAEIEIQKAPIQVNLMERELSNSNLESLIYAIMLANQNFTDESFERIREFHELTRLKFSCKPL